MNISPIIVVNGADVSYVEFVRLLIKRFDDWRLEHCHAAMGVAGEAGELCDAIKRHAIYGKDADRKNIIEELGDIEFFLQDIRTKYGITKIEVLQANADKLAERYKGLVYTDEAAIARADKIEGTASIQLENEISDRAVEECWERAAATGVDHIWYNTKSGKYTFSDEVEQLNSNVYDTVADAITAFTAYAKQLEVQYMCADEACVSCIAEDGTKCINKTHPIEVGNWGIPEVMPGVTFHSIDNLENNK